MATKTEIKRWMLRNYERFIDRSCDEINLTLLVETWDIETQDGVTTADPDHEAWNVAFEVSEDYLSQQ